MPNNLEPRKSHSLLDRLRQDQSSYTREMQAMDTLKNDLLYSLVSLDEFAYTVEEYVTTTSKHSPYMRTLLEEHAKELVREYAKELAEIRKQRAVQLRGELSRPEPIVLDATPVPVRRESWKVPNEVYGLFRGIAAIAWIGIILMGSVLAFQDFTGNARFIFVPCIPIVALLLITVGISWINDIGG